MTRVAWGFLAVAVLVALGCGGAGGEEAANTDQTPVPFEWPAVAPEVELSPEEPQLEPEKNQVPIAEPVGKVKAPKPIVRKGEGPEFVSLKLRGDATLVVEGQHAGGGNFTVHLVPAKKTRVDDRFDGTVFRSWGRFKGQAVVTDLSQGRYRAAIDASKSWKLKFAQPIPNPNARTIPTNLKGNGPRVRQIRVESERPVLVTARHKGPGGFILRLIPMQDVVSLDGEPERLTVFRWRGSMRGERRLDNILPGTYLVSVQAESKWSLGLAAVDA